MFFVVIRLYRQNEQDQYTNILPPMSLCKETTDHGGLRLRLPGLLVCPPAELPVMLRSGSVQLAHRLRSLTPLYQTLIVE